MDSTKLLLAGVGIAVLLGLFAAWQGSQVVVIGSDGEPKTESGLFGGTTAVDSLRLKGNLTVDGTTTQTGDVTFSADITTEGLTIDATNGDNVDLWAVTAASIDADSIGGDATTSTTATVTGASTGDTCLVGLTGSWASPSSSVMVICSITASNTATLEFHNTSSTAINLTASTYNVEVISH